MKILTFSTLFPNAAKPHHGIFTETTLRHQLATGEIQAKVVAPVPWFPFTHKAFGQYGVMPRHRRWKPASASRCSTRATR